MANDLNTGLSRSLDRAVAAQLVSDERIFVQIQGAFKEALVCTDWRVLIVKTGFMTGHTGGASVFQAPYANIMGAQVNRHMLSGYFELNTGGMQNVTTSYWQPGRNNPRERPNCIALTRSNFDQFNRAATYLMQQVRMAHTGIGAPAVAPGGYREAVAPLPMRGNVAADYDRMLQEAREAIAPPPERASAASAKPPSRRRYVLRGVTVLAALLVLAAYFAPPPDKPSAPPGTSPASLPADSTAATATKPVSKPSVGDKLTYFDAPINAGGTGANSPYYSVADDAPIARINGSVHRVGSNNFVVCGAFDDAAAFYDGNISGTLDRDARLMVSKACGFWPPGTAYRITAAQGEFRKLVRVDDDASGWTNDVHALTPEELYNANTTSEQKKQMQTVLESQLKYVMAASVSRPIRTKSHVAPDGGVEICPTLADAIWSNGFYTGPQGAKAKKDCRLWPEGTEFYVVSERGGYFAVSTPAMAQRQKPPVFTGDMQSELEEDFD